MKKSRCLKLILALPILVLITFAGFVSPFGFVLHAHAASLATGAEPIWALPFPTGTSISIGPFGLHGDNFGSMVDKRTGQVFTFDNQTDNDSLDVLLEPVQPQGTATIPTTSLASGTVLAVWPECQLILIDHGHGWWAVYLHLVSIQVTSGDSVSMGSSLGYATTVTPTLPACLNVTSTAEHVHFALLNGSGHHGSYVPMLGRTLCGHPVVEVNNDRTNILLEGLTQTEGQTFTVPACSSTRCGTWQVVSSPNLADGGFLSRVAALSSKDSWAVGYSNVNGGSPHALTLIEHWDGTSWSIIPSQNVGTVANTLDGVAAINKNDVWAVGSSKDPGIWHTLIEHWDGTSVSIVPSPNVLASNILENVAAVNAKDVWATGVSFDLNSGFQQTLIEHWDGTSWSVVPSPNVGTSLSGLGAIQVINARNIWAVGFFNDANGVWHTLVEHWNGKSWSIVSSPDATSANNSLGAISAISATDIWAMGSSDISNSGSQPLVEHWNGSSWNIVPGPSLPPYNSGLGGVAAVSPTSIWAVGYSSPVVNGPQQALIEHWDGTSWSEIPNPNLSVDTSGFFAMAQVPNKNQFWAVGFANSQPLIESYCA